jgi:tuftelin-interacting protein 11
LSQLAIPLITPILKAKMILWDPFGSSIEDEQDADFNDLDYCKDVYIDVKSMLRDTVSNTRAKKTNINMFDRIVWETWMPSFRRIVAKEEMKNISVRCVSLLKNWQSVLPTWIFENILESIIMPKLIDEVDEWDPTVDRIPIHIWIHPWLNLIQNRLETTIFAQIRFKLSNALTNWHPSDASAKAILSPWQPPVFNKNTWDLFVCKNILPKLETVINSEMIINPGEQNVEEWTWISSWQDIIPMASFVDLIEKNFFSKWLKVLCAWLNSSPNYEEVSKWYMGWKSIMGEKLTEHPNIKLKLSQALMMMNRSVNGVKVNYQMFETAEPKKVETEISEEREEMSESFKVIDDPSFN